MSKLEEIAPMLGKAHAQICRNCKGKGHVQGGTGYFGYVPKQCPLCTGAGFLAGMIVGEQL